MAFCMAERDMNIQRKRLQLRKGRLNRCHDALWLACCYQRISDPSCLVCSALVLIHRAAAQALNG
jgi:hypothetical protein